MGAIEEYRARRAKRLAERIDGKEEQEVDKIEEFKKRRAARLAARGIRMDAPDGTEENNNNNQSGGGSKGGGGHGNTRLPFGLCKRFGIDIDPSWTPKDAWAALAGKGITPEKAFEALKKGEDPGSVGTEPEAKKEPVKKIKLGEYGDTEYEELTGYERGFVGRGEGKWMLRGKKVEGTGSGGYSPTRLYKQFKTKMDMMEYLKKAGVEEFSDPETGEIVNPQEIEIPESVLRIVSGVTTTGYTALSMGLRDGRYFLTGTDYDGKKVKLGDWGSKADAEGYVERFGGKVDAIKLSPALKKREAERLSWMKSDKKEYFEKDGKKYGDVTLIQSGSVWHLQGESEDGEKTYVTCRTKTAAMKFLKEQGVQKVRFGKETINPQEFEIPKTVAKIGEQEFSKVEIVTDRYGSLVLVGTDLDGGENHITGMRYGETVNDFKNRLATRYGLSESQITIGDETKAKIEAMQKEEAETARRKAEFEAKSEKFGMSRYSDITLGKDSEGDFAFYGFDEKGQKRKLSYGGDWYDVKKVLESYGKEESDLARYIKDDSIRDDYNKYKQELQEFESRAKKFGGRSYADVRATYIGGYYGLSGIDERGRRTRILTAESYGDLEKTLQDEGHTIDDISWDDDAKKASETAKKAKAAIATGKYYSLGKADEAYTDIRIEQSSDGWKIVGKGFDDEEHNVMEVESWNEAIEQMSRFGVASYKVKDKSGNEMGMPSMGIHKVMMMKKPDGFTIYASTKDGPRKVVHEAKTEQEARKWLRENNVPDGGIKTRGMNPNDAVVRSVVPKALSKFDEHRMSAIDGTYLDNMTMDEKQEVADMLKTVFTQGEYRAARSTNSFLGILENGYKSQIETGHGGSGAAQNIPARKKCSNGMYGHGGINKTEYEVMGYAAPPDIADDYDSQIHPFYGGKSDLTYTFRKDTLKDRVTYTFGDSLNTYGGGRGELKSAGYAGENPTIEGMTGGGKYSTKAAIKAYRDYKNGKIDLSQLIKKVSGEANNNYIELQFTGGVTIKDIQKVSFDSERKIRDAFEGMNADGRKKAIQLLKENNIELEYRANFGDKKFSNGWDWLKKKYPEEFSA